jgi:hypothetical protein
VRVPVDGGTFDVRISGQLRIVRPEAATPLLMFRADRVATFTTSGQPPRDRVTRPIRGNAVVMRPWPGPDDVLEFEMPPLGDQGTVAVPDMFSVRVRLRPTNGR